MTREEILNMPAGQDFDRLIAEFVFGWADIRINDYGNGITLMEGYPRKPSGYVFESVITKQVPFYSTDIAAAWEVANCFEKWRIGCSKSKGYSFWIEDIAVAFAETAALAICRATLLAVMETTKEA